MKIHYSFDIQEKIKNPVITTGSFDGVHIGHKTIINRLNSLANDINGESVLITFNPHPRKVLYPEKSKDLKLISTQHEKKKLLDKAGLDHLFIINFTLEFSKTSSYAFVHDILIKKLHAAIIVVGFNHHFGHNREGDYNYLYKLSKKHNFGVEEIPQQDIENEAVSSTRIRKALSLGNIQRANASLDELFYISGRITKDDYLSSLTGYNYFKIRIEEEVKQIPPDGIYAGSTNISNKQIRCQIVIYSQNDQIISSVLFMDENSKFTENIQTGFFEINMHKKIRGINILNDNEIIKHLEKDKEIIGELIY